MKKELILYVVVNSIKNYKIFDLNLYFVFVSYFIFSLSAPRVHTSHHARMSVHM